jgi:hypothetical protein
MTATLKARIRSASAYARPVIPLTLSLIAGIAVGAEWPGGQAIALAVIGGSAAVIARCLARHRPEMGTGQSGRRLNHRRGAHNQFLPVQVERAAMPGHIGQGVQQKKR